MNLRLFSIAVLISALPILSPGETTINLNEGDFVAAKKLSKTGDTVVSVKLSKSGKAKFKKLNQEFVGKEVEAEIGGMNWRWGPVRPPSVQS